MNKDLQILNVPIEDIIPNRFQPRLNFDETSLKELASSIKEHGIIQPLVLRRLGEKYEIIAGERRYKAAKLAGLTEVPGVIAVMDDRTSAEVAIVENIQRRDLTSIEEAKSYKTLLDKGYLTQEELAKKMGLSQSAISNKLRLLSLSDEVQQAIMENKISERHARSLLQLETEEEQNKWLKKIIDERLTVRELDKRLKEFMNNSDPNSDDIPIIEVNPSIEELKKKATDITNPFGNVVKDAPASEIKTTDGKIPNKFFNYLEDESVNMNVSDFDSTPKEEKTEEVKTEEQPKETEEIKTPEVPKVETKKEEVVLENPNPDIDLKAPVVPIVSTPEPEEIEMLDFLTPDEEVKENKEIKEEIKVPTENKNKEQDMIYVSTVINKVEDDLRNKDYKVSISKEEDSEEVRYTITVSKCF